MDNVSLGRVVGCHPVVLERLSRLEPRLSFSFMVVQGKRTFNMQQAFYLRGRSPLATVNEAYASVGLAALTNEENFKTVTRAKPGYGWHEYGLAIDVAPFDEFHKLDWNTDNPRWAEMLSAADAVGFAQGAQWRTFPDNPHLYPRELPATPGDDVRHAWHEAGIEGVWIHLRDVLEYWETK